MEETTFEFLRNLLNAANNGDKVSRDLLIGILVNANKMRVDTTTILELMTSHNILLNLQKFGLTDVTLYSMPIYKLEKNHCDAYIYNNNIKEVVSIQHKNILTQEMVSLLGIKNYNKLGYFNYLE